MRPVLLNLVTSALLGACGPASLPQAADTEPVADQVAAAPTSHATFPVLTGRVVDQARLLTPEQEALLTQRLASLEQRTTDELVIVTVPSLAGRTIEDFGRNLGNHWGVGQADKDNGVLLIVAPDERRTRIQVGYGLESVLTNQRAAEIIDRDMLPNFREGRWFEGIDAGSGTIVQTLIARERMPRQGRP